MVGSSRVPLILQNIFLSSQQGDDVAKIQAPSNGLGSRMFRTSWGRKQKKGKGKGPIQAPSSNSLSSERSGGSRTGSRSGTVETAADASRKAIKQKKKTQAESPVSKTRVFALRRLLVALTMIISHLFTHSCSF
jgi:hypothetical protein